MFQATENFNTKNGLPHCFKNLEFNKNLNKKNNRRRFNKPARRLLSIRMKSMIFRMKVMLTTNNPSKMRVKFAIINKREARNLNNLNK